MVNVLEMDLTGQAPANRVTEDIKLSRQNRAFPLSKGSFFTKSLQIVNKSTQALLALGKDYRLGELDIEAVRLTPQHEICKEIIMLNTAIDEITVDYQAIGGEFQFNSTSLATMLQEYFDGVGSTHFTNTPDQYASSKHIQNVNDFTKLGGIKNALDRIEIAIKNGKSTPFIESILQYIEELGNALSADVKAQAAELLEQVSFLKKRNEYRDGRYYITARDTNPGAEKGGAWTLDSNVLLYGAEKGSDAGQYIDVGEGAGYVGTLKHLWRRADSGETIIYQLTSSSTDIDEGESVMITLHVAGLPAGSTVPWKLSGVTASDIVGGVLSGNFIIGTDGYASVVIETTKDRTTEGKEILRLSLTNAPTNYISIGINDTSLTPYYRIWFSSDEAGNNTVTSINEGVDVYVQLGGSDLNQGERLYLLLDESTTDVTDFDIALPQYLDIINGRAFAKFRLRADETTEGVEITVVNVCTSNNLNSRVASGSLQVIDSSRSPTYTAKFVASPDGLGTSLSQVNEGTVVYLVIAGDSLKNGTVLQLQYFGQTTQADFVNTLPTTAQIVNGQAIVQYSIKNDYRTEGNEQFGINVLSGGTVAATASLVIVDTSITVGYDMYFSSTSGGVDRITNVSEGDTCYLFVRAVGLADGTALNLGYGGTATIDDIEGTRPATVTVYSGVGFTGIAIKNDRTTEGTELLTVFLQDVEDKPQTSINILDTSLSPVISTKFSSNDRGTDVITNTPEGRSIYLIIQTNNIMDNESLNLTYSGTTNAADFDGVRPTSVVVKSNLAVVEYKIKADAVEEGTERFGVTASYPGRPISSTVTIDVLDTSLPPKLDIAVYVQGTQVTDLNNLTALPGQNVEIRITDINRTLSDNAIIYCKYNTDVGKSPVTLTNRITTTIPNSVQMVSGVASLTFVYNPELHYQDTYTPISFGLTAAEAAGTGSQTDTFRYINIKLMLVDIIGYYSATQNGTPLTSAIGVDQPLWYVLKSNNAPNGSGGSIKVWVAGTDATVANGALTKDFVKEMYFSNGYASQRIYPSAASADGVKQLSTFLMNFSYTSNIPNTEAIMKVLPPTIQETWYLGPVSKKVLLNAGATIEVLLVGSGAGGGGSRYTGGNSEPTMVGGSSQESRIYIYHPSGSEALAKVGAAGGGGEGWWGNGSHFDNGAAGIGAIAYNYYQTSAEYAVDLYYLQNGGNGYGGGSRRRDGGTNSATWLANLPSYVDNLSVYGYGGYGAPGLGDEGWSYGGGGGAGGMLFYRIRNTSAVPITIEMVVGSPGVAGISGVNGEPGGPGAVWYRQMV